MKRLTLTTLAFVLLLSGCGKSTESTLVYKVTYKTNDSAHQIQLGQALEQVVKRRLEAANIQGPVATVTPQGDHAELLISAIPSQDARKTTSDMLAEPFSFDLRTMKEGTGTVQTSSVPNLSDWKKTGITGSDLTWVEVLQDSTTKQIGIELTLTDEGRKKLADVLKNHDKESLGIFVRDFLVSKLTIDSKELKEHIIIYGVPNPNIARVFADDVNVGILTSLSLE